MSREMTLKSYFNDVSDLLANKSKLAGNTTHRGDIGTNRESVLREFLKKHVPSRFSVELGGVIGGANGDCSRQIDVVITSDMSIGFRENERSWCPVESVTAAITVKSDLDKRGLDDALSNLASIPPCDRSVVQFSPLSQGFDRYIMSRPALFVFAYGGVKVEDCANHVIEFYKDREVPFNRVPRAIIVNQKYIIACVQYNVPDATPSTKLDPAHLKGEVLTDATRGKPLFWMTYELGKGVTWLDVYLDYAVYFGSAYD